LRGAGVRREEGRLRLSIKIWSGINRKERVHPTIQNPKIAGGERY